MKNKRKSIGTFSYTTFSRWKIRRKMFENIIHYNFWYKLFGKRHKTREDVYAEYTQFVLGLSGLRPGLCGAPLMAGEVCEYI